MNFMRATLALSAVTFVATSSAASAHSKPVLAFRIEEGLNLNAFLRTGPVAAHVVLRNGHSPRIIIAFPAGNSGTGIWFAHRQTRLHWSLIGKPAPVSRHDAQGRPLHGVRFTTTTRASQLTIARTILSNIRVLRNYENSGHYARAVDVEPVRTQHALTWARNRLDGAPGYRLHVAVVHGHLHGRRITSDAAGAITLRITALTGDTPLTPLPMADLLNRKAAHDPAARRALAFLSYRQKFLAGSWRFDTYFGRDSLMSMRLLMPVLRPDAVEAGLRSVLSRLSPRGTVAHEEDISEFAILDHMKKDGTKSDAPVFNYHPRDETAMLAPVTAAWLLDDARGRARAAAFLRSRDDRYGDHHRKLGEDLVRNFANILKLAVPFARHHRARNLIALQHGEYAGDWRDSRDGLGGGRYPYDVNAVLIPAALSAIARLDRSGLLDPYLNRMDRKIFARAGAMARIWRNRAARFFDLRIGHRAARRQIRKYAAALHVPAHAALKSLPHGAMTFHALALDALGRPLPILHSDVAYALLFSYPRAATLDEDVNNAMRPFPAGLMTGAGMLVANPAYANRRLRARFGRGAYHGTVIWSWQQAMFAAGLARQLGRHDLPGHVRADLRRAQHRIWRVIEATRAMSNSELWSWRYGKGRYRAVAFGARKSDASESDAVQLWSTVYLAIRNPFAETPAR
jgi:hypothetical protein